jgi:hypothetical protein
VAVLLSWCFEGCNPPVDCADNGLQVASLLDLAGTKAKVVLQRAEAKDYLGIDALLTTGGLDLSAALSAAQAIYGKTYTPLSTLKPCRISTTATCASCPRV